VEEQPQVEALPAEDRGKYMLLDRLFRFLKTTDTLNEVLAGYFEKLVISLRKRKEQQFIKYIFGEKNENLDMLVDHVYNTSIAEVLRNMLTVTASNFDPDFQQVIKDKKTSLLYKIIERLTSAFPLHHNMGASSIIIDLMDEKEATELFKALDDTNLRKVCGAALNREAEMAQRATAWNVLNKACKLVSQSEKSQKSNDRDCNDSDNSDDMIVKHANDSDDENKETDTGSAETALSNAFWDLLPHITDFFESCERTQTESTLTTQYSPD